jgi:hypothetical protein
MNRSWSNGHLPRLFGVGCHIWCREASQKRPEVKYLSIIAINSMRMMSAHPPILRLAVSLLSAKFSRDCISALLSFRQLKEVIGLFFSHNIVVGGTSTH